MNIGGEKCQCSLNEVSRAKHDLNSCRYLRREDPSRPAASLNYHGNRLPDEVTYYSLLAFAVIFATSF